LWGKNMIGSTFWGKNWLTAHSGRKHDTAHFG
jgi:hypothetical protein